ncbi:MAG: hypothetical protein JO053_14830, partial [Acidobacteria bacterium]|nr:hypothetical protein [Acidobacteriota bacterium]
LAILPDGSLAVGTGDGGKIYKVRSANASPEASLLLDSSETNIMSLAVDKQGNLYAGTDPGGLVLRCGSDGKPFALLDSNLREVHDLSMGPDGSLYALILGDTISAAKSDGPTPTSTPAASTVSAERPSAPAGEQTKSRYDLTNAKTAVYRIQTDGTADLLWSSTSVSGFSLEATPSGAVIGTSDKGRIYGVRNDGRDALFLQTDASQVSTIVSSGPTHYVTSSNQGTLYRVDDTAGVEGTYDSAVLDAKTTASWGRLWWRSSGNVTIQTRSGNTDKPDESWSAWSTPAPDPKGIQVSSPRARYFQWRATLRAAGAALNEVNVSFSPRNIAPEILSIQVLPTNVGLASNPPLQVDPNIILSGMDPATFGLPNASVPPRRVYQRGATSLQWTAEDRNGDKLVYDVYYKEVGDTAYKLLKGSLDENFLSIDGQSLADGRYIFKVVARDTPSNPAALALSGEKATEPIAIDNTPPLVTATGPGQTVGSMGHFIFDATDAGSYLTRAEYSVNGGDWKPVYADDGISDSAHERYTIDILVPEPGEYAVTIRVYDVNGNAGNARSMLRK